MGARNRAGKKIFFLGPLFHALIGPGECLDGADPLKIHTLPEGEILSGGVNGTGPDKVRRLRGC